MNCKYPLFREAIQEVGLENMETDIYRRQNKVVQYIVTRHILDLCLEAEHRPGW